MLVWDLLCRDGHVAAAITVLAALASLSAAAAAEVELIRDPHFARGFTVSAPAPGRHVLAGVFRPNPDGPEPLWRVCQWSSRFPLTEFAARPAPDGTLTLGNAAKTVRIAPAGGPAADLTLGVNGLLEYDHKARGATDPWVHLLVDQELTTEAWLPQLTALRLHVEVRLLRCERDAVAAYDPHIHAAQVPLFISVQNRNPASPGFGDYYHFGVPLFDNRERSPAAFVAGDAGTGKLMYSPAVTRWTSASPHDGEWVTFEGDLLPEMLAGLQACWERGFLKGSRDLADYRPAGLCVGWEVPGVFDVAIQMRGLSLRAITR